MFLGEFACWFYPRPGIRCAVLLLAQLQVKSSCDAHILRSRHQDGFFMFDSFLRPGLLRVFSHGAGKCTSGFKEVRMRRCLCPHRAYHLSSQRPSHLDELRAAFDERCLADSMLCRQF